MGQKKIDHGVALDRSRCTLLPGIHECNCNVEPRVCVAVSFPRVLEKCERCKIAKEGTHGTTVVSNPFRTVVPLRGETLGISVTFNTCAAEKR